MVDIAQGNCQKVFGEIFSSNFLVLECCSIAYLHAYLHFNHNKYARFQKDSLNTVGEVKYISHKLITVKYDERKDGKRLDG